MPIAFPSLAGARTAKAESFFSSRVLRHAGQAGRSDPRTRASNSRPHSAQAYSKIGIYDIPPLARK
jgi:hypothetical protein